MRGIRWVVALAVLLLALPALPGLADGPVYVLEATAESEFPRRLTLRLRVQSDAAEIEQVQLVYAKVGASSRTIVPVSVQSAHTIDAEYVWKTMQQAGIPPGAAIVYHWVIEDAAGNRLETLDEVVYCDDVRYAWQAKSQGLVTVLWYEGDDAFGQAVLDAAMSATKSLAAEGGVSLSMPVRVVVYADVEAFRSAYLATKQWAGGRSYPEMGLTVQAIPPERPEIIAAVIPHEISHLVFYQATDHAYSDPPAWLNEGLAVRSEMRSHVYEVERVARAAQSGELHSLPALGGGFPPDPEEALLAYAESYCIVTYIAETYGQQGLATLVSNFGEGMTREEAISAALGVSSRQLESDWHAWAADLGSLSSTAYPAQTRRPVLRSALPIALICCAAWSVLVSALAVGAVLIVRRRGNSRDAASKDIVDN